MKNIDMNEFVTRLDSLENRAITAERKGRTYLILGTVAVMGSLMMVGTKPAAAQFGITLASLSAQVTALTARVVVLENKTKFQTVSGTDTIFTATNVSIRNGTGSTTDSPNGLGNLVVGYNDSDNTQTRTGSHNIVLGILNSYTSCSGAIFGCKNKVSQPFSSVLGGFECSATGYNAIVLGGNNNLASGGLTTVSGGALNEAYGVWSSVAGGFSNLAHGDASGVAGGHQNTANGHYSTIVGGRFNKTSGPYTSVSGGLSNEVSGLYSAVLGGESNLASGANTTVTGGKGNSATDSWGSVGGGTNNLENRVAGWRASPSLKN